MWPVAAHGQYSLAAACWLALGAAGLLLAWQSRTSCNKGTSIESISALHAHLLLYRQAEFLQVEAPLNPSKVRQYAAAVALWQALRVKLEVALQLAGNEKRDLWKTFWAAQQRFFKLLCIGLKLDAVIAEVSS